VKHPLDQEHLGVGRSNLRDEIVHEVAFRGAHLLKRTVSKRPQYCRLMVQFHSLWMLFILKIGT